MAQTRALPKAGFSNYSAAGRPLPQGSGLSLEEGVDRPAGAPAEVYNPGEPTQGFALTHWEKRFMPLKIWISPGKKLQDEDISIINKQRPQEVWELVNSGAISSLPQCSGWSPQMNQAAYNGIMQWKEFQNEGLFSFEFVEDPKLANIVLFWAERLTGDEGVGGISTRGNTAAILYPANQVHQAEASTGKPVHGTPVVIELVVDESYGILQARAAHEFGHALGIKAHSNAKQDLMYVNQHSPLLTESDKATIRWLYRQPPKFLMLPPTYMSYEEKQSRIQASKPADDAADSSGARPGGYRIHSARPASLIDASSPEDLLAPSQRAAQEEYSERRKHRGQESPENSEVKDKKKEKHAKKEKKKQHQEQDPGRMPGNSSASGKSATQEIEQEPASRASDGY